MNNVRNHVQLIGHLGQDATIKKFDNGDMIANVSIATTATYKNNKGEKVDKTSWHRIVGRGKTAELMEKYFTKGKEVAIMGRLNYRNYTDKDGNERTITEIMILDFSFIGKNKAA